MFHSSPEIVCVRTSCCPTTAGTSSRPRSGSSCRTWEWCPASPSWWSVGHQAAVVIRDGAGAWPGSGEGLSEASWLAGGLSVTLCLLAAVSRRLHNKLCHWAVAAELLMVQLLIFWLRHSIIKSYYLSDLNFTFPIYPSFPHIIIETPWFYFYFIYFGSRLATIGSL